MEQLIESTLNEHVAYQTKPLDLRNQRIYCVKVRRFQDIMLKLIAPCTQVGVNSLLDVARQTYKEANLDAADLVAQLSGTVQWSTLYAPSLNR